MLYRAPTIVAESCPYRRPSLGVEKKFADAVSVPGLLPLLCQSVWPRPVVLPYWHVGEHLVELAADEKACWK